MDYVGRLRTSKSGIYHLHTVEVAGSNPAAPTNSFFAGVGMAGCAVSSAL